MNDTINEICIGNNKLGPDHPTYIVAEMSGNHGANLSRALETVRAVKRSVANAIKLQTYKADTITLKYNSKDFIFHLDHLGKYNRLFGNYMIMQVLLGIGIKKIFKEARLIGLDVF
jgi:sialic acid synthase SpsE